MKITKEMKKQAKQIKAEEKEKYKERTQQVDQKVDTVADKAREYSYFWFGHKFTDIFRLGYVYRGLLWVLQAVLLLPVSFLSVMYLATNVLPQIGIQIGHTLGLGVKAPLIDQFNLMFMPTMFVGAFLFILDMLVLYGLWKVLDWVFGHARFRSKFKHNLV